MYQNRLKDALITKLDYMNLRYQKCLSSRVFKEPKRFIYDNYQKIDNNLKKLESFPIWTLSDKFEIIPNAVAISVIGSTTNVIVFPIKTTANIIKGCIKLTDATFPGSRH